MFYASKTFQYVPYASYYVFQSFPINSMPYLSCTIFPIPCFREFHISIWKTYKYPRIPGCLTSFRFRSGSIPFHFRNHPIVSILHLLPGLRQQVGRAFLPFHSGPLFHPEIPFHWLPFFLPFGSGLLPLFPLFLPFWRLHPPLTGKALESPRTPILTGPISNSLCFDGVHRDTGRGDGEAQVFEVNCVRWSPLNSLLTYLPAGLTH